MSLNILLVDDHAIVRQGIRQLLIDRGVARDVTEAENGGDAMAAVDKQEFDVILLDISLPDTNGIEVLKRLKRKLTRTPVLMFSMYREDQYAVRALKAGAAGYLSKTVNAAQMIGAIQQVAAGRKYVSPRWPRRSPNTCRSRTNRCRTRSCPIANTRRSACSRPASGSPISRTRCRCR